MIDRRAAMGGIAAALVLPGRVAARSPALRTALDVGIADPRRGLAALARIDDEALRPAERLDLVSARAGLAIDDALAARIGPGRAGRPLFGLTPRQGAWRAARPDAAAIDVDTGMLARDAARGIRLPAFAIDRTAAALAGVGAPTPAVAAALARQRSALITQRDGAPPPGLSHLRDGAAIYALLLRRSGGSDADPGSALARLERERDRLLTRADRLFAQIGLRDGSVGERYVQAWRDPRYLYSDDDAGRLRAVADMNRIIARRRGEAMRSFGAVPPYCLDVDVRALSPAELAAGRSGYRDIPGPSRRGAYIVDLTEIRRRPAWTLPAVVAHELLPGHMLQLGIEAGDPPHALRLDYAGAFVEGWAIHAEALARAAPVRDRLGTLHWLLFRVGRAIVDLRLHLDGWTFAQARAALAEWQGEPAYFAPYDAELERIALEPASRVAEALAWFAIDDATRGRTGAALAARHHAILAGGRKRPETIAAITKVLP